MTGNPGEPYLQPNGAWRDNANETWWRDHQLNPETGLFDGPYPLPPAGIARGVQALHDRAIWQYRQRLMQQGQARLRGGTQYAQGALGLLQSYRPGGSAALEAGVYQNAGRMMQQEGAGYFQQAQMTQPLDMLSDLRRHEDVMAARRADRANERMMIAGIIGGAAQTYAMTNYGGGEGAGQRFSGGDGGQAIRTPGGGDGGGGGGQPGGDSLAASLEREAGQPVVQGPNPLQGGQQPGQQPGQQQGSPFQGAAQQGQQTQQGLPYEPFSQATPGGPGGGGTGAGGGQGGRMGSQPGGGAGAGPAMPTMMGGAPGIDGNFSSASFAAAAAASPVAQASPMARISLSHYIADLYESDPFFQTLPYAINSRWRERVGAA